MCVCVCSYALGRESKKTDSLARQQKQEPLINYKAQANAYSSQHLSRHCPSFLINALLVGGKKKKFRLAQKLDANSKLGYQQKAKM